MTEPNDDERTDESPVELINRVGDHISRRSFMNDAATAGAGALALSALGPGVAAAQGGNDGDDNSGGSEDVSDLDILNFALTLEHLEAAYYNEFLDEHSESEVENSDVAKYFARPTLRYSTYQQIQDVRDHEEAHVEALTATIEKLGGTPVEAAEYEFPYDTMEEFVALSDRIEAVGVSAYAGAAPLIDNEEVLKAAVSIHSVEANHQTYFQLLHLQRPAPNAFNEARSMEQVLPIAKQFIVGADGSSGEQTFSVTVENVSKPGTLDTDRAKGAVPLSPGAWGVFTGDNPAFNVGESANKGTMLIAEDGFPGGDLPPESGGLADTLAEAGNVSDSGTFASPGGPMDTPALLPGKPGESAEFTVSASPGDHLTLETMFVQSNDWFYGFEGLSLFDGDEPVSGDVTDQLGLYDAGTEEDTAPGTGEFQKPVQDPMATDVGPDESKPIQLAEERHPDFDIPDASEVIKITITPQ